MYFPYLRGKQYELIALREMGEFLGGSIVPIIEPVREVEGSGLERCLSQLGESGAQLPIVILNPRVGHLANQFVVPQIADVAMGQGALAQPRVGLSVDEESDIPGLVASYLSSNVANAELSIIVKALAPGMSLSPLANLNPEFAIIEDHRPTQRQVQRELQGTRRVSLADCFRPEQRNADYLSRTGSVFSEEHLYFAADGLAGFSDYLTIGEQFSEGGFSPRAVAIHWTYQEKPNEPILIRHFASETGSNDTTDVGGKFLEAADKLVEAMQPFQPTTRAFQQVCEHVENGTYPGLGVVKKLSIQNHLELMARVLDK